VLWLKVEGANPHRVVSRDRGMTVAISKAVEDGAKAVVCGRPATRRRPPGRLRGAARPGLACVVLIPDGYIALGKLAQALVHGARGRPGEGKLRTAPWRFVRERRKKSL